MEKTLTVVRNLGAINVVLADGLQSAQQLSGAPELDDPLGLVAYASHPYPTNEFDEGSQAWNTKFGDFAAGKPVIITEWGVGYYCDSKTPQSVVNFLEYLQEHRVGLEAVAWDWGPYDFASAIQNFPDNQFSSLLTPATPASCSAATHFNPGQGDGPATSYGPGRTIRSWYLTGTPPTTPE